MSTNLKSVSSMKLHRDLSINQRSAWFLAHRLRVALSEEGGVFSGPVEVDETYFGGKRANMSNAKRKELAGTGRGTVGKVAVVGAKDRATKQVAAKVVERTDAATLQGFVASHAAPGAIVYSDDSSAYDSLPFDHDTVKHSLFEYVKGHVHTNGIESPCGRCSSGRIPGRSTSSARSTWTGTCRSSRPATTCATKTPSTSWRPSLEECAVSDCATGNSSRPMGSNQGRDRHSPTDIA